MFLSILDSMDPLAHIFPEVHDSVLQHFNEADFQEITEVSPNWNKIIGKSMVLMKNVTLFLPTRYEKEMMNTFLSRRYRNILLNLSFFSSYEIDNMFKYIRVLSLNFWRLKICTIGLLGPMNEDIIDTFDLSRLKVLIIGSLTEEMSSKLLDRCHSLKKFELRGIQQEDRRRLPLVPSCLPFLERNHYLQDITLARVQCYKLFFERDISTIVRFQLKHLKIYITYGYSPEISENSKKNLMKFLRKQSQSLESFSFDACHRNEVEQVFNNMPMITSLGISMKNESEFLRLNLNEKIVELSFPVEIPKDFENFTSLTPRLKKLLLPNLTSENIEIIARNLPELKTLEFFRSELTVGGEPVWSNLAPNAIARDVPGFRNFKWFIEIE